MCVCVIKYYIRCHSVCIRERKKERKKERKGKKRREKKRKKKKKEIGFGCESATFFLTLPSLYTFCP